MAGNSYTLTCVAIADVMPQVTWIDPSGIEVEEKQGLTLSGPVVLGNHTTLNLTFNYLLTSQAGRYSCASNTVTPASVRSGAWNVTVQCESNKHSYSGVLRHAAPSAMHVINAN